MESLKVVTWRIAHVRAADLERIARHADALPGRLAQALGHRDFVEIATCQRVIVTLLDPRHAEEVAADVRGAIADDAPAPEVLEGYDAFSHLAEVASSLDSLVPGEMQILGQMKGAYQAALGRNQVGKGLNHVFQLVFRTAKRVRTDTALFEGKVSLIPLTLDLLDTHLAGVQDPHAVVVGTGTMGRKMIEHLHDRRVALTIVSRSRQRAVETAEKYGARAMTLQEFLTSPPAADVVALATREDQPFLTDEKAEALARERGSLLIDLALPRNSDESVRRVKGVHLVQMDDLHERSEQTKAERHAEIENARKILRAELADVRRHYDNLHLDREVVKLRTAMLEAASERLQRATRDLKRANPSDEEFLKWYDQTVRHLLHVAQTRLRDVGPQPEATAALNHAKATARTPATQGPE